MKSALTMQVVKLVGPAILGGLGTWLLTAYPTFHAAFCQVTP